MTNATPDPGPSKMPGPIGVLHWQLVHAKPNAEDAIDQLRRAFVQLENVTRDFHLLQQEPEVARASQEGRELNAS